MISSSLKILLVCDLDDWILGEIARQLSKILSDNFHILVLVSHSRDFRKVFRRAQPQYDIVHFLSPWDFFNYADQVTKPCVVNLWHMVDWQTFERHVSRIDTLCVGSEQWKIRSLSHVPQVLPLTRMPYGLDTQRFSKSETARQSFILQNHLPEDVVIFGFAGSGWSNEGNRKGLDRLWECLSMLKATLQLPFIVRVMGRHWPINIAPENLKENTVLDLDKSAEDTPSFYSTLDYYLCTSREEGVPYPVLEAMSCECTVLSTEVGIVPEIFDNKKNGYLLRNDHLLGDFINAVSQTYQDKVLRNSIGLAARETITTSLEWSKVVNARDFADIYEAAIHFYYQRSRSQRLTYQISNFFSTPKAFSKKIIAKLSGLPRKIWQFRSEYSIKGR